jgi:hypothetical protein
MARLIITIEASTTLGDAHRAIQPILRAMTVAPEQSLDWAFSNGVVVLMNSAGERIGEARVERIGE